MDGRTERLRSRWIVGERFQNLDMVWLPRGVVGSRSAGCFPAARDRLTAFLCDLVVERMLDGTSWLTVGHVANSDDCLGGDEVRAAVRPGDEDRGIDGADRESGHRFDTSAEVDADLLADYPGAYGHQVARGDFDRSAHV